MNAPERIQAESKAKFAWDDPLLLGEQLTEEERMVRDAAHAYAQEKLLPRVTEAFRHETSDPAIFPRDGRAGAPRARRFPPSTAARGSTTSATA